VQVPIIGIGGIQSLDDVMEFLVAGATAVQIGTANFYNPGLVNQLITELPEAIRSLGATGPGEIIGCLHTQTTSK
jgi:dihydroorotate dehydrogenase (NAD+) catalytic subunit